MIEKVRLGELCRIQGGYAFKSNQFQKNNIPIIRIGNIQENKVLIDNDICYTKEFLNSHPEFEIKNGDLLIAMSGATVGKVGIYSSKESALLNQRVGKFVITDKIESRYLYFLLLSPLFEKFILNNAFGCAQPNISNKQIEEFKFNKYSIETQIEIANKLDKVQEIIDLRKKQTEELDELIKSQFVEMFGNPKLNEKNWIKAPMGKYMTVLTDFSSNGSYKTLDSTVVMYDEPNYAYMVRTIDLENEEYKNNVKYITEEAYNFLSKSKVYPNDIIMNKIGSAGKVYLMPDVGMPVSLGRNAFLFRYNDDVVPLFIYYLLKSEYGTNEISQYVRGAVTKTITKDDVRKVKIIVPPIELQNKFAEFVRQIDEQKISIEKGLKETEELQESLMNKYFS